MRFSIGDSYELANDATPFTPPSVRNDFVIGGTLTFVSGAVMSGGNMVRHRGSL
jgi:hypothetical protein